MWEAFSYRLTAWNGETIAKSIRCQNLLHSLIRLAGQRRVIIIKILFSESVQEWRSGIPSKEGFFLLLFSHFSINSIARKTKVSNLFGSVSSRHHKSYRLLSYQVYEVECSFLRVIPEFFLLILLTRNLFVYNEVTSVPCLFLCN